MIGADDLENAQQIRWKSKSKISWEEFSSLFHNGIDNERALDNYTDEANEEDDDNYGSEDDRFMLRSSQFSLKSLQGESAMANELQYVQIFRNKG